MANKRFDHAPKFVVKDDAVIIQQAVGSSAPLLDVKDHTGSSLMSITSAGAMTGASLTSPALTGTPTAPTPTAGTNTTQIATTEFVISEISNIFGAAPAALNTLDELAAALNDDANFATTVTNALATKAPLVSPTFTGTVSLPSDTSIGNVSATELGYLDGVTSAIQTQLNGKLSTAVTSLTGTSNQISVSASTGAVTVSIPSSPTLSGTITAGGFYAVGTTTLNRSSATAWNAGANINLQINGVTYSTIGVNGDFRVQFSGGIEATTSFIGSMRVGAWSAAGNYHVVEGNYGYAILGNAVGDGDIYLRTFGGGAVNIGGANTNTFRVGNNWVSNSGVYNGPLSNGGIVIRLRSGNEGSFIWDGSFGFLVDNNRVKNFTIQHPTKPDNYLVHACSEGPTSDVFYRGTGQLEKGIAVIHLPDYFEDLTEVEGRTVMITPIADETGVVANLAAYEIHNGSFVVEQIGGYVVPNQRFWWRVDAVRKNTSFPVEPLKSSVNVGGFGPYTFIDEV